MHVQPNRGLEATDSLTSTRSRHGSVDGDCVLRFARKSLEPAVLQTLALVADTIAKGIERKWAEKKLQHSERNLRLFMETIPQMLWSATPDGAIDYYNQRVLDYAALSLDELRGEGWI